MASTEQTTPGRTAARARRREQLIEATMKCIGRRGIGGTTLADVAREAGLSQGIVNLHFQSKENLFIETLKSLAEDYRAQFEGALQRGDGSPAGRLMSLMELDLSHSVCQPAKLAVWFAFWGEVKSRPTYRKICDEVDRYYDEVILQLCAEIIDSGYYPQITAMNVATVLASMTNGLWLSCLISPQEWSRHAALDAVHCYLSTVFPQHFRRSGAT